MGTGPGRGPEVVVRPVTSEGGPADHLPVRGQVRRRLGERRGRGGVLLRRGGRLRGRARRPVRRAGSSRRAFLLFLGLLFLGALERGGGGGGDGDGSGGYASGRRHGSGRRRVLERRGEGQLGRRRRGGALLGLLDAPLVEGRGAEGNTPGVGLRAERLA